MSRFIAYLHRTELIVLVVLLTTILLLSVMQILLRNFWGGGIIWAESLIQVLVLWITLIGAMIASGNASHITIDLILKYAPYNYRIIISRVVFSATAIVSLITAYYCTLFVVVEYEDEAIAFANVPSWLPASILPIAFFIIGIRYFVFSFNPNLAKQ